jgi:hypothetical protein
MSAEIIRLADRRPPGAGALAAACRALTLSLDRLRQHGAAIRTDLERLQRDAAAGIVHA